MQTDAFAAALKELMALDGETTVAIMCSEAVPWRCHRSLIGDALLVQTHRVEDIFVTPAGKTHRRLHTLTSFARVQGSKLWYPEDAMLAPFPDESRNITLKGDRRQDGVKKHTGRPQAVRSFLKKF